MFEAFLPFIAALLKCALLWQNIQL